MCSPLDIILYSLTAHGNDKRIIRELTVYDVIAQKNHTKAQHLIKPHELPPNFINYV